MKVIFLDIDGVICCNLMGRLEEYKMAQLQKSTTSRIRTLTPEPRRPRCATVQTWLHIPMVSACSCTVDRGEVVLSTDWRRVASEAASHHGLQAAWDRSNWRHNDRCILLCARWSERTQLE